MDDDEIGKSSGYDGDDDTKGTPGTGFLNIFLVLTNVCKGR